MEISCTGCRKKFIPEKEFVETWEKRLDEYFRISQNHSSDRFYMNKQFDGYIEAYKELYPNANEDDLLSLARFNEAYTNCATPSEALCKKCRKELKKLEKSKQKKMKKSKLDGYDEIWIPIEKNFQHEMNHQEMLENICYDYQRTIFYLTQAFNAFNNHYSLLRGEIGFRHFLDLCVSSIYSLRDYLMFLASHISLDYSINLHKINYEDARDIVKKNSYSGDFSKLLVLLNKIKGTLSLADLARYRNITNHTIDYKIDFGELSWLEISTSIFDALKILRESINCFSEENIAKAITLNSVSFPFANLELFTNFFKIDDSSFEIYGGIQSKFSKLFFKKVEPKFNIMIESYSGKTEKKFEVFNFLSKEEKELSLIHHMFHAQNKNSIYLTQFTKEVKPEYYFYRLAANNIYSQLDKTVEFINVFENKSFKTYFNEIDFEGNLSKSIYAPLKRIMNSKERIIVSEYRNISNHYINIDCFLDESHYETIIKSLLYIQNQLSLFFIGIIETHLTGDFGD